MDIEKIEQQRPDQSPIYLGKVIFYLIKGKKETRFSVKNIVMKGTKAEALRSPATKARVIYSHLERDKKKAAAFDVTKIRLEAVEFKKFLGYGIK